MHFPDQRRSIPGKIKLFLYHFEKILSLFSKLQSNQTPSRHVYLTDFRKRMSFIQNTISGEYAPMPIIILLALS